ncbi:isoprenoid synthase domain-containing protein [Mycena olivaceomarginata]|nr:isoprenoid synthase domain-containing protein [Mycena olivaceomarginata]
MTSSPLALPDLESHCPFSHRKNRYRKSVSAETKNWFFTGDSTLREKQLESFRGLNPTLLAAVCYPEAGYPQLRLCSGFLAYLFFLDNLSDELDNRDTVSVADQVLNSLYHPHTFRSSIRIAVMSKDICKRIKQTSTPAVYHRFVETFDLFLQSVHDQAIHRTTGVIPTLEDYIRLRRDTSGCKPCWAIIEYANNLDIPNNIMDHPVVHGLGEAANDLVAWSNDVFSYSVEQSKGDTHNMVVVVMHHRSLDLPAAVEFVGDLCKEAMARFTSQKNQLPSWGDHIDRHVSSYIQGLEDWMSGILFWSFETERYFGKAVRTVKATRTVRLVNSESISLLPSDEAVLQPKQLQK